MSISSAAKRIVADISVLFLLLVGIIFLISLWTYNPSDQNEFKMLSEANFTNSIGLIGAYLSYGSYWLLGITAWLILIPSFWVPLKYLFAERTEETNINLKKMQKVIAKQFSETLSFDEKFMVSSFTTFFVTRPNKSPKVKNETEFVSFNRENFYGKYKYLNYQYANLIEHSLNAQLLIF